MRRSRARKAWFDDSARLRRFERGVHQILPVRRGVQTKGPSAGLHYRFRLPVPTEGDRKVKVTFRRDSPAVVRATVEDEGPQESPHRYGGSELCMWHPKASREDRWVIADGLIELIGHVHAHLVREAWWRRTGEWVGPEAPHGEDPDETKAQAA